MRKRTLVVQGVLLVCLAVGCAKTPATTTASAPPPTGPTSTTPDRTAERAAERAGDSGGPRSTTATDASSRPRIEGFRAIGDVADIHFAFDKYDIRPADTKILDANAAWLKAHPDQIVLIEGHCDERGTVEYNLALGERRAKTTQNYLVAGGVQAGRVSIISYGKERPACTEATEACWAQNRRAHFLVKAR